MRIELYKFLREDFVSEYGQKRYQKDRWYRTTKPLAMCEWGFHASQRIIDAFLIVSGEILCQVEVRGKSLPDSDKQCWSELKILKAWKWQKKDSVALALFADQQVLPIYEQKFPDDPRPRLDIEAAQRWLENPIAGADEAAAKAAAEAIWVAEDIWATETIGPVGPAFLNRIEEWLKDHLTELEEI